MSDQRSLIDERARFAFELGRAQYSLTMRDWALDAVSQGILILHCGPDVPCHVIYASPGFERMTGYAEADVIGDGIDFLHGEETDPEAVERITRAFRTGERSTVECLSRRKDGSTFWSKVRMSPLRGADDSLAHLVIVLTDITERRRLEEQYVQAQKMEAVGRLAGGVAHDFNNLLTIIQGYSDLLLQSLPANDPNRELIHEIHRAGERSAALTRQLLVFSRKQVVDPRVVDVTAVVKNAEKLLARLIGEDVRLETVLGESLGHIRIDPGQLEQVLMNLAINARDAMPQGGRLLIETKDVHLDEHYAHLHGEVRRGDYVLLAVSDNGCGMTSAVRARVFEPFFTTKEAGHGTGLGLSVVHGIVKEAEGLIDIYTEPGFGTMFKLYFPRVDAPSKSNGSVSDAAVAPTGTETVLLVEDEDGVRALSTHILKKLGYHVMSAPGGPEALKIVRDMKDELHLLITDVIMPNIGGRQLAEEVVSRHPETRVLYLSGYTDDAVVRHGILHHDVQFLQKPFSPTGLALKVREVLDA